MKFSLPLTVKLCKLTVLIGKYSLYFDKELVF